MSVRAQVTKNGAVLLGDSVACDAFDEDQTFADCNSCPRRPPWRLTEKLEVLREGFDD